MNNKNKDKIMNMKNLRSRCIYLDLKKRSLIQISKFNMINKSVHEVGPSTIKVQTNAQFKDLVKNMMTIKRYEFSQPNKQNELNISMRYQDKPYITSCKCYKRIKSNTSLSQKNIIVFNGKKTDALAFNKSTFDNKNYERRKYHRSLLLKKQNSLSQQKISMKPICKKLLVSSCRSKYEEQFHNIFKHNDQFSLLTNSNIIIDKDKHEIKINSPKIEIIIKKKKRNSLSSFS